MDFSTIFSAVISGLIGAGGGLAVYIFKTNHDYKLKEVRRKKALKTMLLSKLKTDTDYLENKQLKDQVDLYGMSVHLGIYNWEELELELAYYFPDSFNYLAKYFRNCTILNQVDDVVSKIDSETATEILSTYINNSKSALKKLEKED